MRTFRWVLLRLAMLCRWAADGNRGGDKRIGTVSNGEPYDPAKYPYVVSLAMYRPAARSYGSCTGTLLSARFALTAAHCTDGVAPRDVKVFRAHRERSAVRAIHQHRGYDAKTLVADVSLLEVSRPFRRVERFAALSGSPAEYADGAEVPCEIVGFGATGRDDEGAGAGTRGYVATVRSKYGPNACLPHIGQNNPKWREFLCSRPDARMICPGDSGGPMICNGYQYGIASHGYDTRVRNDEFACGDPDTQTVHLFVYNYVHWITATMDGAGAGAAAAAAAAAGRNAFLCCLFISFLSSIVDRR